MGLGMGAGRGKGLKSRRCGAGGGLQKQSGAPEVRRQNSVSAAVVAGVEAET